MKSNNPVFARSEEFNRTSSNAYGNQTYAAGGSSYPGYGDAGTDPSTWGTGTPGQVDQGRMTVDSVVQKTAISIALVFVTAIATWWWIGDCHRHGTPSVDEAASRGLTCWPCSVPAERSCSRWSNSFKRVISPALVLAFAAAEGVALGAVSKVFEAQFDGIVTRRSSAPSPRSPARSPPTSSSTSRSATSSAAASSPACSAWWASACCRSC